MTEKALHSIAAGWRVANVRDSEVFFRSLGLLIPRSAVLVLVERSMSKDVREYTLRHALPSDVGLPIGRGWPPSRVHSVAAEPDVLEGLAVLAARHAEPELCDDVLVHNGEEVLLEWYDAFHDPLTVSTAVGEANVGLFCRAVGVPNEPWQAV